MDDHLAYLFYSLFFDRLQRFGYPSDCSRNYYLCKHECEKGLYPMKNAISLSSILGGSVSASRRASTTLVNQLVLPGVLLLLACLCLSAHAQTGANEWTWMGGSDVVGQPGVYGTLGTPAVGNIPGNRHSTSSWTDSNGNFWLFGGFTYSCGGYFLNELWEFNPSTSEWVWMGGGCGESGVYGTLGAPAAGNTPGGRNLATSWADSGGNLWLFGGFGYDANGTQSYLNDLWKFNPSTDQWIWISGNNTGNRSGVYGTLGSPAIGNTPGSRYSAVSWTDRNNNLWLFGGYGMDANGTYLGILNDLWEFNPFTNQWTWMGGSSTAPGSSEGQPGIYGTLGTPAAGNIPGGRSGAEGWTDSSGNFWLFGGGSTLGGNSLWLNDLWKFNPSTNQWAWMSGSSTVSTCGTFQSRYYGQYTYCGQPGVYGTLGTPAAGNIPGGRSGAEGWTDSSGNLWLFGGGGFDANEIYGGLNDLWEFSPSTNQWMWMGGSTTLVCGMNGQPGDYCGQPGVYGTLGVAAAGNIPGGRQYGSSWTDSSGNFWLFGGAANDVNGNSYYINDLWKYQPLPSAITPTFSLAAGTYTAPQSVTISDTTPGATIYYTLDGSTPTTSSMVYSGAITVSSSETIKAVATATGYSTSAVASATYVINLPPTAAPVFTPAAGTYTTIQKIKITDSMKGASIYYTLDGSTPTTASAVYTGKISINQTTTINAIAVATGYSSSSVASAIYIITIAAAPTFTPAAGTYGQAQWVTLASATPNATIYYTADGSTPSESSIQYTGPIAVSATTTIKAIATTVGYTDSPVASAKFTLVSSPRVFTGLASGIATPTATLNATVHDFDSAGQFWFLWGTSSTALNSSTEKATLPALSGAQIVSAPLTGLAGATTYYFQPVAETVGGTSYGAIQSFTTN
jgi:N-acetylneuraminic acid mutarotase